MPITKTPTVASTSAATPGTAPSSLADEPPSLGPTKIAADDRDFLQRVSTFLFQIQTFAKRAQLHGYDDAEHAHGYRLLDLASGRTRPLSHWIAEQAEVGTPVQFTAAQLQLLQEIDKFENEWFPRVRGILQRTIPEDRGDAFRAAFFRDLRQQPLGPAVLDSVATLLTRFEELETSREPGAAESFALGRKRGLTAERIGAMRQLIERARTSFRAPAVVPGVDAKTLADAQKTQLEALKELRRWYNDWAATFRTVFGTRAQIRLGLTSLKRASDDGAPEDESAPEAAPAPVAGTAATAAGGPK